MSRSVIIVVLVASIAVVLASAIEEATIGSQTTQQQNDSSRLRIVTTPQRTTSKYCADLSPLREFLATSIEPYYAPLIGLLPDNIQIVLLDKTSFGGFSNASCLLASFLLFVVLLSWFAAAKSLQTSAQNTNARLNEFIVSLKLALNQANLKSNAFEHEIGELQNRLKESERKLSKAEEDRNEASEHRAKELEERLKQNESRVSKEVNTLKLELAESVEREERQKTDYEAQISELVERLGKLNEELEKSDSSIREMKEREMKLTAELESVSASVTNHKESSDDTNSKRNVSINDQSNNSAVVRVIELEEKMSELEKEVKAKSNECLSLSEMVKSSEEKQRDLERQLKESEMQIRILNDLREKDTKQHIKSMADLDNQLKKKCTESEKITLMLDQVRAKSERIHELEAQFARIERQSTNERQTYEKQAHENWLQARKNERELKDARQELVTVKERLADAEASVKALQSENQLLKQQQQQNLYKFPAGYYMNSPNLNRSIESPSGSAPLTTQLEIDTAGGENPSSSGATNNNNTHNNHNNHHNHDSRGSSSASSSSGGPVSNSNHKKQHPHPVSGSNSQHSVHHQPSPKFMTPPPSMMAYPSPNGLNGSSGGPTPPPIPQPPLIPYEYPQHVMMKMMHQQQQYMQNYKYMAAAAAAYANAVAASSSNASIGRASPSASSQASPRQHHNSLTMNHSATYPNGNSTSFLNESSSVGNLNSPRETSLEKDDSSLKPNEENSPIQNSTKNDLNDHLTSTTTKKDDLVPTNLASNFEV